MSYVSPNWDAWLEDAVDRSSLAAKQAQSSPAMQQISGLINPDPFTRWQVGESALRAERNKMLSEFDWDRRFDQAYLRWFFQRWPNPSKYLTVGE